MAAESTRLKRVRRNATIEEAPLQGERMLFDPANAKFFVLNPTMAFVWDGCDGETPLQEIAKRMIATFDGVDAATASRDVQAAVTELISLGLLLD